MRNLTPKKLISSNLYLGWKKRLLLWILYNLSEATKADFWELYDAYEVERKAIGKERIALLEDYAAKYNNMSDETADALMKNALAINKKSEKLLAKYYKKIKKKTSAKVATQFYQFEAYVSSTMRSKILENIPFVGEFDD